MEEVYCILTKKEYIALKIESATKDLRNQIEFENTIIS
jgi:hypothetical protein